MWEEEGRPEGEDNSHRLWLAAEARFEAENAEVKDAGIEPALGKPARPAKKKADEPAAEKPARSAKAKTAKPAPKKSEKKEKAQSVKAKSGEPMDEKASEPKSKAK
jgi:hypothetical protein